MQWRVYDRFRVEKLSAHCMYTIINASHFDYQWWQAKNPWRSLEAHSHEGVWSILLSFFHIKAANTLIIYRNDHIAFELPDLHNQKSLMLCWRSISEWGREREARSFADQASQYHMWEWSLPIATHITNDARPNMVDGPLMLILPWVYPQYVMI